MSDPTNRDQPEAYPWDTVRTDCWSQVRSVFREEGPQGELAVFYRAAPVDNARRLDEEQIQCLRDELLTLRATCHRLQAEQAALQASLRSLVKHNEGSFGSDDYVMVRKEDFQQLAALVPLPPQEET